MFIQTHSSLRPSPIAGRWYPGNPSQLAKSVDAYIAAAKLPSLKGEVIGVMAPHAGYSYSGAVAAFAFAALCDRNPDLIAVVSPMHQYSAAPLLTTAHRAYVTPLGEIPIASECLDSLNQILENRLGFGLTSISHDGEHSLEIELPFLQRVIQSDFKLIPVMVRDSSSQVMHALGSALAEVLKPLNAVLVASTDLSHFYPQNLAHQYDAELLRRVKAFHPEDVLKAEEEGVGFACGRGALAAAMWAAWDLGADQIEILKYATSGDISGDYSQVVGYAAAVMLRSNPGAD